MATLTNEEKQSARPWRNENLRSDEWEFMQLEWLAYGDCLYYKNKNTGEIVFEYRSMGD